MTRPFDLDLLNLRSNSIISFIRLSSGNFFYIGVGSVYKDKHSSNYLIL